MRIARDFDSVRKTNNRNIYSYFSKLETSVFAVDLEYWRIQSVNPLSIETTDTRNLNILIDFLIKCKCDVAD